MINPGAGTATAAMLLALLCSPGLLFLCFMTVEPILDPSAPTALLWMNLLLGATETVLLVTGAVLLFRRKTAGRRMIAVAGTVAALQCLSVSLQASLTGAQLTMDDSFGVLIFVIAPLTAVAAVAAVITARHPATVRWCLPQNPNTVSSGPGTARM